MTKAHVIFLQGVETSERERNVPGDRPLNAGEPSPTPALRRPARPYFVGGGISTFFSSSSRLLNSAVHSVTLSTLPKPA